MRVERVRSVINRWVRMGGRVRQLQYTEGERSMYQLLGVEGKVYEQGEEDDLVMKPA